jgi:uncharacterized protein
MGTYVPPASDALVRSARRGLTAYLLGVAALTAILEGALIINHQPALFNVLMFVPGFVALAVRLARHEGFDDVSFGWGGPRTGLAIALSIALPIGVGAVGYGLAWILGLVQLNIPDTLPGGSPIGRFAILLLLGGGVNAFFGLVLAAGEEIGWRGYMLPRLIGARIPFAVFAGGVIWGLWHLPMILSGVYAAGPNPVESAAVFMISVVSLGFLIARVRLATGSIWPAVVMHATWNAVIQNVFDRVSDGAQAQVWVGESGLLIAGTLVILAVVTTRLSVSVAAPARFTARANVA